MVIGIGIDIIEIERIKKAIERWGETFLTRIFNSEEIEYAQKFQNPFQHYAARFAVKEAVFKAMGNPKLTWKDLTVVNEKDGSPRCLYRDKSFNNTILISISHSHHYAVANAIITSK